MPELPFTAGHVENLSKVFVGYYLLHNMCVLFVCYWIPVEWQDESYFFLIRDRHTGSWPLNRNGPEEPKDIAQSVQYSA